MNIALITGASSGLGVKYIESVAARYPDLDEIWIIARRRERLEEYAEEHPDWRIRPVVLDLSKETAYDELAGFLQEKEAVVKVLVNNAGYCRSGRFDSMDKEDILTMIELNIKGFTMVNYACVPYMEKGSVGIMTCSVSGFTPIPMQAVYSASKAYVQYFSRAFYEEMKEKGVKILAMCPGNMDTEMNPKGKGKQSRRINLLPYLDMAVISNRSLALASKGHAIYTPGIFYKFYRLACKMLPKAVMGKLAVQVYR